MVAAHDEPGTRTPLRRPGEPSWRQPTARGHRAAEDPGSAPLACGPSLRVTGMTDQATPPTNPKPGHFRPFRRVVESQRKCAPERLAKPPRWWKDPDWRASGSNHRDSVTYVHLALELRVSVSPACLRGIHREIRVAQKLITADAGPVERDTDADRGRHLICAQGQRRTCCHQDSFRQLDGFARVSDLFDENPKLVPPDARCGVGPALTSDNALGDRLENRVTRGMPKPIVDCLEVVHVQEEDSETTMASFDPCGRMLKPILEEGSVAEAGERIVKRLV